MSCHHNVIDNTKIIDLIRFLAPDLSEVNDEIIGAAINIYSRHLWRERFGKFYDEALAYYVAHHVKLHELIAYQGSDAGGVVGGPITSEHEGDLSRSYGNVSGTPSDGYSASLMKTWYGQQFLRIRDMAIAPVMTRFG